eukprot:Gb_00083 [translate_table: standard]
MLIQQAAGSHQSCLQISACGYNGSCSRIGRNFSKQASRKPSRAVRVEHHCNNLRSLPPVRGRVPNSSQLHIGSKTGVNQREEKSKKGGQSEKPTGASHTYDYFRDKWDKFDVDSALREVDEGSEDKAPARKVAAAEVRKSPSKVVPMQKSSRGDFGDGDQGRGHYLGNSGTIDRLRSALSVNDSSPDATSEKEMGNEYFKEKKYVQAIECYARSIVLQPTSVAFANRAMAYIKIRRCEDTIFNVQRLQNSQITHMLIFVIDVAPASGIFLPSQAGTIYWAYISPNIILELPSPTDRTLSEMSRCACLILLSPLIIDIHDRLRFEEAECDCSEAINLDDRYVKAYSRRGTARRELGKILAAIEGKYRIFLKSGLVGARKQGAKETISRGESIV